ncbi:MAG: ankyrin repeat domain-containing protein, partial [Deltaproteobacteria bacterium]|nr:ankyrin repeat domain-containing protein [Deltaproteobacteria bacterium]
MDAANHFIYRKTMRFYFIVIILCFQILNACSSSGNKIYHTQFSNYYSNPELYFFNFVKKGSIIEVMHLLEEKIVDVNARDSMGRTAVIIAAQKGHLGMVEYLILQKADVNIHDTEGSTALMMAVNNKYLDIATVIVNQNADLNIRDQSGDTPLIIAIEYS